MSVSKSNSELVAIYRLEFYKKKKNWKISTSRPGKQSRDKHITKKTNLNSTYNIANVEEEEVSDLLNVAFVEKESDTIQNIQNSLISTDLSQEWQKPINIWPLKNDNTNCDIYNIPTNSVDINCEENSGKICPSQRMQLLLRLLHEDCKEEQNSPNIQNKSLYPEELSYNLVDNDCNHMEEFPCNKSCEVAWGKCVSELEGKDVVDGENPVDQLCFEPRLLYNSTSVSPVPPEFENAQEVGDLSDSFGEFVRGADAAPHSSEIDLKLPESVDIVDVSVSCISRMSSQQLQHAAQLYANVLWKLQQEQEYRQQLRLRRETNSLDELPTRDAGFDLLHSEQFIAGSHKMQEGSGTGRGRGRLQDIEGWIQ